MIDQLMTFSAITPIEPPKRPCTNAIAILLAAWIPRALFLLVIPGEARSLDLDSWRGAAILLLQGKNPYNGSAFLNYPPLWMQVLYFAAHFSLRTAIPFHRVIEILLIAIESVLILCTWRLIRLLRPRAIAARLVIIGLCLNPIAILQVCQHGQFDVLVALWVVLFITALITYERNHDPVDWLVACAFLGMGILTKTVPLVLVPLLMPGAAVVRPKIRALGALLLFGPVTLGLSVVYVLGPAAVTQNVLQYRSLPGYFGITGLMEIAGAREPFTRYSAIYSIATALLLLALAVRLWHLKSLNETALVLSAAILLCLIPALGPGYGPQYIYWSMPLLVVSYATGMAAWRRIVLAFFGIAIVTYAVEYALVLPYGWFLHVCFPADPDLTQLGLSLSTPRARTLLSLPLFVAYLVLIVAGARQILSSITSPAKHSGRTSAIVL
jgi:hypothetical protein